MQIMVILIGEIVSKYHDTLYILPVDTLPFAPPILLGTPLSVGYPLTGQHLVREFLGKRSVIS